MSANIKEAFDIYTDAALLRRWADLLDAIDAQVEGAARDAGYEPLWSTYHVTTNRSALGQQLEDTYTVVVEKEDS